MRFAIPATLLAAAILLLLGVMRFAYGAPPLSADPALAPWFQGLQQPSGASCCSEADCRPVESRVTDGHWEALLPDGRWLTIPHEKIIHPKSNPIGRAVLCASPVQPDVIYCFTEPILA